MSMILKAVAIRRDTAPPTMPPPLYRHAVGPIGLKNMSWTLVATDVPVKAMIAQSPLHGCSGLRQRRSNSDAFAETVRPTTHTDAKATKRRGSRMSRSALLLRRNDEGT